MHGKQVAHIIKKKREAKANRPQSVDTCPPVVQPAVVVVAEQPTPEMLKLQSDFDAAWACFHELDGPHIMWRIDDLIKRGLSWKILGITGPKRTTFQDSIFIDIVRYAKSKAKKGKDRYDIVKIWFGADAGVNTKRDIVLSHCTIKNLPTMQARYQWLKDMNEAISSGLPAVLDYYEIFHGRTRTLPKMNDAAAIQHKTNALYRRTQSDQYMRTRQPRFRTTLEAQTGGAGGVPKGTAAHPTQTTKLQGWESGGRPRTEPKKK